MTNTASSYKHSSTGRTLTPSPTRSRIGISIADPVLEHLDELASALNKSRSRLIEELVTLAMEQVTLSETKASALT